MTEIFYPIVLLANAVLTAFLIGWYMRRECASLFHPATFYFVFHVLVFVFRPTVGYLLDLDEIYRVYEFRPSTADKLVSQLITILGLLTFILVSTWVAKSPITFVDETGGERDYRRKLVRPLGFAAILIAPLALYSLMSTIFTRASGTSTMIMRGGVTINTVDNGYFATAQFLLPTLCVLCAWTFRWRAAALLPAFAFVLLRAATGGRGPIVIMLIALALAWAFDNRKRWPTPRAFMLVAAASLIFVLVGADRGASVRGFLLDDETQTAGRQASIQGLGGMDFGNSEYLEYLVYAIPQRTGTYGYFLDNLQLFTEPVPRVWWKGKPIGEPFPQYDLFDYGYPIGMTFSMPGEGWSQFGWLGVVLWSSLFALVLGRLYEAFARPDASPLRRISWFLILSATVLCFRDGKLVPIVKSLSVFLLPVGVFWLGIKLYSVQLQPSRNGHRSGAPTLGKTPARRRAEMVAVLRDRQKAD